MSVQPLHINEVFICCLVSHRHSTILIFFGKKSKSFRYASYPVSGINFLFHFVRLILIHSPSYLTHFIGLCQFSVFCFFSSSVFPFFSFHPRLKTHGRHALIPIPPDCLYLPKFLFLILYHICFGRIANPASL